MIESDEIDKFKWKEIQENGVLYLLNQFLAIFGYKIYINKEGTETLCGHFKNIFFQYEKTEKFEKILLSLLNKIRKQEENFNKEFNKQKINLISELIQEFEVNKNE